MELNEVQELMKLVREAEIGFFDDARVATAVAESIGKTVELSSQNSGWSMHMSTDVLDEICFGVSDIDFETKKQGLLSMIESYRKSIEHAGRAVRIALNPMGAANP